MFELPDYDVTVWIQYFKFDENFKRKSYQFQISHRMKVQSMVDK
jgi:hypothetical protein